VDEMSEQPANNNAQASLAMNIPPEQEAGTYANFAGVWRGDDGFVLDFAVTTAPPQPVRDENGAEGLVVPARVVSRVRIPASQAWALMRALNTQLDLWEAEHGSGA
jgi:hypothetical protein